MSNASSMNVEVDEYERARSVDTEIPIDMNTLYVRPNALCEIYASVVTRAGRKSRRARRVDAE